MDPSNHGEKAYGIFPAGVMDTPGWQTNDDFNDTGQVNAMQDAFDFGGASQKAAFDAFDQVHPIWRGDT